MVTVISYGLFEVKRAIETIYGFLFSRNFFCKKRKKKMNVQKQIKNKKTCYFDTLTVFGRSQGFMSVIRYLLFAL